MEINWTSELTDLLKRLSSTQEQMLSLLAKKRDLLLHRNHQGLAELMPEEESLCQELQSCQQHRQQLLDKAASEGLPSDSIQSLAASLPNENEKTLRNSMNESIERSRLLRHQSIVQWVVVQRTMLHLSHMLEIIATGGQSQPTYGKGGATDTNGALMDQAV